MNLLNKYFLFFDIFGERPEFFINGYHSQKTIFGSIISLLLYISLIILFIIFSLDIIYHENPTLVKTNYIDEIPDVYNFDNNFMVGIVLEYPNYTKFINDKIYTLKVHETNYSYINGTSVINSVREIKYKKCSEFNFTIVPEYFEELDINNIFCLNLTGYSLEGEYMRNRWRTILFNFEKCINSTENNFTCESEEVIDQTLNGGYIELFITDTTIIPNNYKTPIKYFGRNIFSSLEGKDYSEFWLYLKRMDVITDNGLIFHNYNKKYAIAYDRNNFMKFSFKNRVFLQVAFKLATNREVYHRSYKKIQEICADISGLSKGIIYFLEFFFYIFKKTFYKNYLLQFFNLDFKKDKQKIKFVIKRNNCLYNEKLNKNKVFNNFSTIINNNKENNINISNSNINLKFCNSEKKNKFLTIKYLTAKRKNTIVLNKEENLTSKKNLKINMNTIGIHRFISVNQYFYKYCCVSKYNNIYEIHKKFLLIRFLFEISTYLKKINEINLIKNVIFEEKTIINLNKLYHFNYNLDLEKNEYDYLSDYNKNIFLNMFI